MKPPRLSVVIPAYNREAVVGRAIDSVLAQTFQDFEILIVDDASTDSTPDIIQGYRDHRIRYFRHETNRYSAAARNTAMKEARGEFIAFLDSDDEWLPEKSRAQINRLDSLDASWGCVYSPANIFRNSTTDYTVISPTRDGNLLEPLLMNEIPIWTPTFMFRRKIIQEIGLMDEQLRRSQDLDFFIRIFDKYKVALTCQPVANIFLDTTKSLSLIATDSKQRLLAKHADKIDSLGFWKAKRIHANSNFSMATLMIADRRYFAGLKTALIGAAKYPFVGSRKYASLGYSFWKSLFKN